MAFTIKRGDTLPNLPFVLFEPDGVTPLDLTTATSVYIIVRTAGGTVQNPGTLLFKKQCTILDAANGAGIYDWVTADTTASGSFSYEFEVTWNDGNVQTIPASGYLDLSITDDLG